MDNDLKYRHTLPDKTLVHFVDSFWSLQNMSASEKEIVVLPDGRVDLFFTKSSAAPFHIVLLGIQKKFEPTIIPPGRNTFAISFKPLAVEYLFHNLVHGPLKDVHRLPASFWDFRCEDLDDFELFCEKAIYKINAITPKFIDERKRKLFELIHSSNGEMSIHDISNQVLWSSRQINRYFNQKFGISLKMYCKILRFRASFQHIKEGELFPQLDFSDQSHFIKDVKAYSGVSPKKLQQNKNDRFVQLSVLSSK